MLTVDPIVVRNPNRIADWVMGSPDRYEFLRDTLFVMRNQYPERELVVELDSDDDDVLIVTPSEETAFRFRHSEYREISENSLIERYTTWRKQFDEWWYGYQQFAVYLNAHNADKKPVIHTPRG
jgi:hypothetical protein